MMDGLPKLLGFGGEELGAISVLRFGRAGKQIGDSARSHRIAAQHQNACLRIGDTRIVFEPASKSQSVNAGLPFMMITREQERLLIFARSEAGVCGIWIVARDN